MKRWTAAIALTIALAMSVGIALPTSSQPKPRETDAHALCFHEVKACIGGPFKAFWLDNGLEFGDEGVSYRESLALWGFPLTGAYPTRNKDGDTVLTQVFERMVMEYHPQHVGTPYEVQFRRMGAEFLDRAYGHTP